MTMTNQENADAPQQEKRSRKIFLRDAVVFQGKLLVDGLRDLTMSPVSIIAAIIDLIKGGDTHGRYFYDVLHFGRHTEKWINLFEAADRAPDTEQPRPNIDLPSIDEFVNRFENMIAEEYKRGDISASAKRVVDETVLAAEKLMKKKVKQADSAEQANQESSGEQNDSSVGGGEK